MSSKLNKLEPAPYKEINACECIHGGTATVTFFFDSKYKPIEKEKATRAIVHEYDEKGRSLHRDYQVLRDGIIIPSEELCDQDFSDGFEDHITLPKPHRTRRASSTAQGGQKQTRSRNANAPASRKHTRTAADHAPHSQNRGRNAASKPPVRSSAQGSKPAANERRDAQVASGTRASDLPNRPARPRRNRTRSSNRPHAPRAPQGKG